MDEDDAEGKGADRNSLFGSEGVAKYYSKTEIWTHALPPGLQITDPFTALTLVCAHPTKKPFGFSDPAPPPRSCKRCDVCLDPGSNATSP